MGKASADHTEFVVVGKITKAHGILGEVKIYSYSGEPENFLHYKTIYLEGMGSKGMHPLTIKRCRVQSNVVLAKLKGIDSRTEAERLVGSEILIDGADLAPLGADEFYWHDLVGKDVRTDDERIIGKVSNIFNNGAHDILTVYDGQREYLIPMRDEFVVSIDDEIRVSLPPGLLDINES
ncbi:MAG: ribosome maturation factor RimM [Desulfobulbaceae bacterium]|nr:ribosome maturation factor RimM [Desulfobulbaceae bacterium]